MRGWRKYEEVRLLDKAQQYLEEAGMEVALIEGIESDPSVTTVMDGARKMLEFEPDWIVAIGGGSPIDAARLCGLSTSTQNVHLKTCARCLVFLSFERRRTFAQYPLHRELPQKLLLFRNYLTMTRVSNIRSQISRLHQTLLLSIQILQRRCHRSL